MGRILSSDKTLAGSEPHAPHDDELKQFDIGRIIRETRNDPKVHAGRITKMLTKGPGLRIGLILMEAGTNWEEHKTESRIIVQPLEGRIRFTSHHGATEIGPGELLVLAPGEPHSVKALEQTAFLLTLG